MRILFRYMLREHIRIFAMCFVGLMTVYLVVDFFEKVRKFIRYDAEIMTILGYFLLRTPIISFQIAPLALLMATLLTLGMFSRNHEITAMRSCGISLYRIMSPLVSFSFVMAAALLGLSAVVIPLTTAQSEYVKTVFIEKKSSTANLKTARPWIQIGNQTLMNIEVVDPDGMTLHGVSLYRLGPDFKLIEITEAREARYTGYGWMLHTGTRRSLQPDGSLLTDIFGSLPLPISQTPADFNSWLSVESDEMTLLDIRTHVERLRRDGYNALRFLTDYHGRIAFPFVSVVMVLLGVALSLRRSGVRGGGMALGIGQALVIGFCYWATHSVAIALGRSGVLAPMLAGWMANLVFGSFAGYLLLTVRH